jgi:hypothetical protein
MAQFARPDQDVVSWTTGTFADIDESVASDSDFISSETSPADDVYVCRLSAVTDPSSSSDHIIRYRYRKSDAGAPQQDLTVQLREGYVNEGSPGTLIEEWVHTDISATFATATQTLGSTEADSITDYASLYMRFSANEA